MHCAPVEVELAAHAFAIEAQHAAAAGGGTPVDMEEVELAHVGQFGHPETRRAGRLVQQVVLFRDAQAHLVDMLRGTELALFPGLQTLFDAAPEEGAIEPGDGAHQFLLQQ